MISPIRRFSLFRSTSLPPLTLISQPRQHASNTSTTTLLKLSQGILTCHSHLLSFPISSPTMPYNTNAIPPRKEPTGQTQLPCKLTDSLCPIFSIQVNPHCSVSRVKKIISQDPDVQMCSNNAAFVITLATVRRCLSFHDFQSLPANTVSHLHAGNVHPASH